MTDLVLGSLDGGARYSMFEARDALAGYAFFTEGPHLRPSRYGTGIKPEPRARWGYRTYDCIPASPGSALSDLDLLVASGLNARLDVNAVAGLQSVRVEVDAALAELSDDLTFWSLDESQVSTAAGEGPDEDSPSWWMHRAWEVLMSAGDVGAATTHKVLHHKRPAVFPLLDRQTLAAIPK